MKVPGRVLAHVSEALATVIASFHGLNPQSPQPTVCCYFCASTVIPGRPGPPTIGFNMVDNVSLYDDMVSKFFLFSDVSLGAANI